MKTKRRAGLTALLLAILAPLVMLVGITPAQAATTYMKYSWSSDIYRVVDGGAGTKLTLAQWQAAGQPTPSTVNWIPGSAVFRYQTSTNEIFVRAPGGTVTHHLTTAEWVAMGQPGPQVDPNYFYKYTWNDNVVRRAGNEYYWLDAQWWSAFGQPTPQYVQSLPGDSWCKVPNGNNIYFSNPPAGVPAMYVTAQMYAAAGSPRYVTC
jgi:hypothetical protein